MDISRDELHRALRDLDAEHRAAMPRWREALARLFDDPGTPSSAKAQALLGGFGRRRFLKVGGTAVGAGVLLAACGDDDSETTSGTTAGATATTGSGTTAGTGANETDITVARTAASLELFAVSVYDTAIDSAEALGIERAVATAAMLFRDQHQEHADAFNGAAAQLGGDPYDRPNPTAQDAFADRIAGLANQTDVVRFAYDLENVAAQTYQGVGATMLSTPTLRQTAMSVGGVEARHAAILAGVLGETPVPNAFFPTDQAVTSDFFV